MVKAGVHTTVDFGARTYWGQDGRRVGWQELYGRGELRRVTADGLELGYPCLLAGDSQSLELSGGAQVLRLQVVRLGAGGCCLLL